MVILFFLLKQAHKDNGMGQFAVLPLKKDKFLVYIYFNTQLRSIYIDMDILEIDEGENM